MVLLWLALLSACVHASWHGVSPDLERKLIAVSSFTCDNGQQRLDISRLNDNYCDCVDGSDEPGTSACSHTSAVFHCVNAGFFSMDIPTSIVNDGICDCCDGSDEYASGVSCPHDCVQKMEAFKLDKMDVIEQIEAGLSDRVVLVKEAQKLLKEELEKLKTLETSVESLKIMVEQLQARKIEDERLENDEKAKRVLDSRETILSELGLLELTQEQLLSVILEIGRTGLSNKNDLLPIIRKEREAAVTNEDNLPNTVMDDKHEAFLARDKVHQAETHNTEESTDEHETEGTEKKDDENEAEKEDEEERTQPEVEMHPIDVLYAELAASEQFEGADAIFTRKELDKTVTELKEEERKFNGTLQVLKKNYGDNIVFFALRNKCVETMAGQYKYKICLYGQATQDNTRLGTMDDLISESEESEAGSREKYLKFLNGDKCWNGPKRSITVELQCGPEPMELFEIEEPSTCVYTAKLRTPAVCNEEDRERIMSTNSAVVVPHHIEIEVPPTL
ncbi:putative mannose-6-phosphate receptor binding domain superfamily, glucosidase II beta subunit [Plasmopara halstedii]